MIDIDRLYNFRSNHWSDIQDHLPYLRSVARGEVLELGVRGGISTSALLAGVVENGGHLYSIDHKYCGDALGGRHPQWTFLQKDSLDADWVDGRVFDLVFIDTTHTYERTKLELTLWGELVRSGGKILLHDIDDPSSSPGVRLAIYDYCFSNRIINFWLIPGSNGLGIIEK